MPVSLLTEKIFWDRGEAFKFHFAWQERKYLSQFIIQY